MTHIKFIISVCGIIGSTFSVGEKIPDLSYKKENIDKTTYNCVLVESNKNQFVCAVHQLDSKTSKEKELPPVTYRLAKVDDKVMFLANDTKSQIFHFKGYQVVHHERIINSDASQEKVCVGNLIEKR